MSPPEFERRGEALKAIYDKLEELRVGMVDAFYTDEKAVDAIEGASGLTLTGSLGVVADSPQILLKSDIPSTHAANVGFIDKNLVLQDLIGYYPIADVVEIGCPVKDILVVGTAIDFGSTPADRFVAGSIMGMSVDGAIGYDSVTGMFETRLGGSRGWKIATSYKAIMPTSARGATITGQCYFDPVLNEWKCWNGAEWRSIKM